MYKKFYGLKANPFNVNPDPRFLYLTRPGQEVLACLLHGVQARKGFVMLTGEVGTGKTTLVNAFLNRLREQHVATAFVFNPRLNPSEFLRFAMTDFGIAADTTDKGELLMRLNMWLLGRYRAGETAVLVIDEAQDASPELLEEVRLLTNLETASHKLLQIILCGQPELAATLRRNELRQVWQRITLRCQTGPLSEADLGEYIQHRLRVAGANGAPIFTEAAVKAISQYSRGVQRIVNVLCENALIMGYVDQHHAIGAETIHTVAREFELDVISPIRPRDETVSPDPHTVAAQAPTHNH